MNDQIRDAYERELTNSEIKRRDNEIARLKAELASMTQARDEVQAVAVAHRDQIAFLQGQQTGSVNALVKQDLKPRTIAALCALRLGARTGSSICYAIGDQPVESTVDLLVDLTERGLIAYVCNDWFLTFEGVGWCDANGILVADTARCWARVHSERKAQRRDAIKSAFLAEIAECDMIEPYHRKGAAGCVAERALRNLDELAATVGAPALPAEDKSPATQHAYTKRVRSVVQNAIMTTQSDKPGWDVWYPQRFADVVADRVAAELAAPARAPVLSIGLPPRKEWNAARYDHGDTNEAESSDYVDGWNDALDAVEASAPVLSAEDRGALVAVHCVANDAANRTPKGTFRDRLFLGVVALDRLLGGG